MEKEEFHRDPMTEVIGAVGPFQIVWHVVLGLSIVIHAWQMFANKWLTYKVREVQSVRSTLSQCIVKFFHSSCESLPGQ